MRRHSGYFARSAPLALAGLLPTLLLLSSPGTTKVDVVVDDAARRVDVSVDGKPFTSYIYPRSIRSARRAGGRLRAGIRSIPARASASIIRTMWASGSTMAT